MSDKDRHRCQCSRWTEHCRTRMTQEDLLCDICREGCSLLQIGPADGSRWTIRGHQPDAVQLCRPPVRPRPPPRFLGDWPLNVSTRCHPVAMRALLSRLTLPYRRRSFYRYAARQGLYLLRPDGRVRG